MLNQKNDKLEQQALKDEVVEKVTGGEEPFRETIQLIVPDVVNEKGKTLADMIGGN